jgi:hypothetical protein
MRSLVKTLMMTNGAFTGSPRHTRSEDEWKSGQSEPLPHLKKCAVPIQGTEGYDGSMAPPDIKDYITFKNRPCLDCIRRLGWPLGSTANPPETSTQTHGSAC